MIVSVANPLEKSCSIHPRRQYGDVPSWDTLYMIELVSLIMPGYRMSQNGTSPIVTLEERLMKARSSMALLTNLMAKMFFESNVRTKWKRAIYFKRPSRSRKGSILGSEPLKRRYRVIGSSVPPFSRIFFRNAVAVFWSNRLVSLKA
jgi:hypothetical protein